jgi:hypothetical protein
MSWTELKVEEQTQKAIQVGAIISKVLISWGFDVETATNNAAALTKKDDLIRHFISLKFGICDFDLDEVQRREMTNDALFMIHHYESEIVKTLIGGTAEFSAISEEAPLVKQVTATLLDRIVAAVTAEQFLYILPSAAYAEA